MSILRDTLAAVEAHQLAIVEGMTASLAASDPGRGAAWARKAARCLVTMLIAQARHLAAGDGPRDLSSMRLEHLRTDIGWPHYARFGDALAAILFDRVSLPRQVGAAWCEAFWSVVLRLKRDDLTPIAAGHALTDAGGRRASAAASL